MITATPSGAAFMNRPDQRDIAGSQAGIRAKPLRNTPSHRRIDCSRTTLQRQCRSTVCPIGMGLWARGLLMFSQIKIVFLRGRLALSSTVAALTVLGWAGASAIAADMTSIGRPETAQAGAEPADAATVQSGDEQSSAVRQGASDFKAYGDWETGELTEPSGNAPPEGRAAAGADGEARMQRAPCPGNSADRT